MSQTDKILARRDGPIGYLIFNNPGRHNAVSMEMWDATRRVMDDFEKDNDVRVVVIRGEGGKAFVSGADISKFGSERATREAVLAYNETTESAYRGIHGFPKPTLAMIEGFCIGGGLGLAVSCDIRICSEKSRFALPAARLGLGYDYPGVRRLMDVVGPAFAKEIFFTARQFDAEEARQMGLVNRVVPSAQLESYVKSYADAIGGNAPLTVGAAKYIVGQALKQDSERDYAAMSAAVARCFASKDYVEGRTAFMEKRKPVFTGS